MPQTLEGSQPVQNLARKSLYLLYHEIRATNSAYSYVLPEADFEKHITLFSELRQTSPTLLPEITFDDGHVSNIEIAAPILARHGMKATFFVTAGWTGHRPGYMSANHLRSLLQEGHIIGAHGWSHKLLTHCNNDELAHELTDAKHALEDIVGAPVKTMSLPGGRYNSHVLSACISSGYDHVFTSGPRAEPMPLGPLVGRLNILSSMQLPWITSLFSPDGNLLSSLNRQYQIKSLAKSVMGDRLYAKLWALVNRHEPQQAME